MPHACMHMLFLSGLGISVILALSKYCYIFLFLQSRIIYWSLNICQNSHVKLYGSGFFVQKFFDCLLCFCFGSHFWKTVFTQIIHFIQVSNSYIKSYAKQSHDFSAYCFSGQFSLVIFYFVCLCTPFPFSFFQLG